MVDFLRLDESVHPVFLSLLECFDHLSLVQQVFLILAEVLRANILDLAQLVVVLFLQGLSMNLRLRCRIVHEGAHAFYLLIQFRV